MTRRDEQIEADQAAVITIAILNSSSATVVLAVGALTGGVWRGAQPVPGTPITAGPTTFLNAGQSVFSPVGGYITLTPAGGGSISLSWNLPPGGSLQAYGNVSGTSALSLSYQATNVSTFQPTVTYLITDPGGDEK